MFRKKINFFDAHFHFPHCAQNNLIDENSVENIYGLSCALTKTEQEMQENCTEKIFKAYGIHPKDAAAINIENEIEYLDQLLQEKKICAVGECGFDFYDDKMKAEEEKQNRVFLMQIELAKKYNCPLVIHCRKANERLFVLSDDLKKVPAVLFHSFMGNSVEAKSLLNRGINGFFSFGKQMMNGNKKVIDCVKNLPLENLLFETDAPYQFLKGEKYTRPEEISKIYRAGFLLRENKFLSEKEISGACEIEFYNKKNAAQENQSAIETKINSIPEIPSEQNYIDFIEKINSSEFIRMLG